jgi:hypothetical protein
MALFFGSEKSYTDADNYDRIFRKPKEVEDGQNEADERRESVKRDIPRE